MSRLPLLLLVLLSPVFASCSEDPVARSVRDSFSALKAALVAGDAEAAVAQVTRGSVAHFDRCIELARTADAGRVRGLDTAEKLLVLRMRHHIPPDELDGMDGEAAFMHAVRERWITQEQTLTRGGISGVIVEGNRARGRILLDGRPRDEYFRFQLENGKWRLDVPPSFEIAATAVAREARMRKISEDQYIQEVLGGEARLPLPDDIWAPLN